MLPPSTLIIIIILHIIEDGIGGSVTLLPRSKREYDDTLTRYTHKRSEATLLEKEIHPLRQEIEAIRARMALPPASPPASTQPALQLAKDEHTQLQSRFQALVDQLQVLETASAERVGACSRTI